MHAEFSRPRHDVLAGSEPLDDHSTDLIWIPPHSSLWHLQLLSCKVCLMRVSQSRGALQARINQWSARLSI